MGTFEKHRFQRTRPSYMRKLVKKEKFTGQTIVTAPCDEVVVVEEDTINTFDRRRMIGSLSHWGPEYTQPQFDDKESFLRFMEPSDPRSVLKRSKLPKYHWVTRGVRVTPSRKFTGTLAPNPTAYDKISLDQTASSKSSVGVISKKGDLDIALSDVEDVEEEMEEKSVVSVATVSVASEEKSDRGVTPLDKLRRTVSDGSLSVVSVGSNTSAQSSPNLNNTTVGSPSGGRQESISSVTRKEQKRLKEAEGTYI